MDQIPRYIKNKLNPEHIEYTHIALEPILKVTYGCMVYQEQVMQIFRELADYSLGQADLVRRAMGKKKLDVMAKERENFIKGALKHNIDEKSANTIFDEMSEFAKYAFNKSHAACYAVVSYQTAYLKTYYFVEYMAALLNSFLGNQTKVAEYIDECNRNSVEVLKPSINKSYAKFTAIDKTIMFGMGSIKNVGLGAVKAIVDEREKNGEYADFIDFCERISSEQVNKKCIESLIKAGVFDEFGKNRTTLLRSFEKILDGINNENKKNIQGQVSLFQLDMKQDVMIDKYTFDEVEKENIKQVLADEKDMLGIYITGHPLEEYRSLIEENANINSLNINEFDENKDNIENIEAIGSTGIRDGLDAKYAGIITSKKIMTTRNNQMMAFITVEDLYGSVEIVVFPKIYSRYANILQSDIPILITGKISVREDESTKILANDIVQLKEKKINIIEINTKELNDNKIKQIISAIHFFEGEFGNCQIVLNQDYEKSINNVQMTTDILNEFKQIVGDKNIKIYEK